MNNNENAISHFKIFAAGLLKEQIAELKKLSDSHEVSGKLERLKIFNAQLDVFKQKLSEETAVILNNAKQPAAGHTELQRALDAAGKEYLNDFMYSGFIKKDE